MSSFRVCGPNELFKARKRDCVYGGFGGDLVYFEIRGQKSEEAASGGAHRRWKALGARNRERRAV